MTHDGDGDSDGDGGTHLMFCRHRHIAEAQPYVNEKFTQFREENAMANLGDDASLKDLSRAAKQMTTYKTEMSKV